MLPSPLRWAQIAASRKYRFSQFISSRKQRIQRYSIGADQVVDSFDRIVGSWQIILE